MNCPENKEWGMDDVKSIQTELLKNYINRNICVQNPPNQSVNGLDFRSCLHSIRQNCITDGGSDE